MKETGRGEKWQIDEQEGTHSRQWGFNRGFGSNLKDDGG